MDKEILKNICRIYEQFLDECGVNIVEDYHGMKMHDKTGYIKINR